jgi:Immunity protein Imm1
MGTVLLRYGDVGRGEFEERPATFAELERRLEEIRNEYNRLLKMPYSVDLIRGGIGILSVGLGDGYWILAYHPEAEEQSLTSLGDESADGDVLFFFGDHTLLSRKYLVPRESALSAVRTWFEEGKIGQDVRWTSKLY